MESGATKMFLVKLLTKFIPTGRRKLTPQNVKTTHISNNGPGLDTVTSGNVGEQVSRLQILISLQKLLHPEGNRYPFLYRKGMDGLCSSDKEKTIKAAVS